jgi:dynein heavy chain 2, cytosolic
MDLIIELGSQELRKNKNVWMAKLEQIKSFIEVGCGDKDPKYCRKWKVHCDVQLFKVLEMQFLAGIEEGESVLPEIQVELLLKNKQLQFKPSM